MDSSFWFCVFDNNNHQAKSPCLSFSTNSRTSRSRCACYREKSSSQSNSSSGRTQTLISCTLIFLPVRPQMYSIVIGIIIIRPTNQFLLKLNLMWCMGRQWWWWWWWWIPFSWNIYWAGTTRRKNLEMTRASFNPCVKRQEGEIRNGTARLLLMMMHPMYVWRWYSTHK